MSEIGFMIFGLVCFLIGYVLGCMCGIGGNWD
jgi:hypothetical protein